MTAWLAACSAGEHLAWQPLASGLRSGAGGSRGRRVEFLRRCRCID